jgi:hypothetical protein
MFAIRDPGAGCRGVLARGDGRCKTHQCHEFTLALDVQSQDAKPAIGVVKRYALNETIKAFELLGRRLLRFPTDRHVFGDSGGSLADAQWGMLMRCVFHAMFELGIGLLSEARNIVVKRGCKSDRISIGKVGGRPSDIPVNGRKDLS